MEKIRKVIQRKMMLREVGDNHVIVPDLSVVYNIKLLLTSDSKNCGYFKRYDNSDRV